MPDQPNSDPPDEITAGSTPPSGAPPQRTTGGSMRWTPPSPEHLQRMLPQYEILEMIGHGGMGAVYRAKQISLDRLVAIKILPPEAADDELQFIQRFKNEARTMAKMMHPTIIAVFDFGETSEGQLYFVMEFVDGTDVSKMIKDQGKLLPAHALAITAHVCDALQYAHAHGIIHRDIKPANILLNIEGAVKVADFGLAKMHDPSLTAGLTQSGKAMGTPDFVAPESLTLGMVADHRADLYAIGVMLYQMLTGKIPRGAYKSPSQVVPGLDARFDAIVHRAMQEDREDRYQSAHEIRCALDVILTTPEIKVEAPPASASTQAFPPHAQSAQQSAAPARKPVARGPQPRNNGTLAVAQSTPPAVAHTAPLTDGMSAVVPKKKPIVPIGIGAAAMLGIGAFFLFKSPEPKPVVPTQEASKPAPKPEIVQSTPPKVSSPSTYSPTPTKTVMPAPVIASATLTGAVNLLTLVDVQRDAVGGDWKMTPEGLKVSSGDKEILLFQQSAPEEYDYEIEFTITNGSYQRCYMILPLSHGSITWQMGYQNIDPTQFFFGPKFDKRSNEEPGHTNPSRLHPRLTPNKRYRCLVEVRKDSLRALLDGEEVLKWSGDLKRFSGIDGILDGQADKKRLGVSSFRTPLTFHKAELRPPSASGKPADKPITTAPVIASAPLTGPVNLLALVDLQRDVVEGEWKMTSDGLTPKTGVSRLLMFQQGAPAEYDYEIEFTIVEGWHRCKMVLPLPQKTIFWEMGSGALQDTKLFAFGPYLDGQNTDDPGRTEAVASRPKLEAKRRYRCLVEVRKDSLRALLDGEEILKWSGDFNRLSSGDRAINTLSDPKRLGLATHRTLLTFHKAELRPPSAALKPADKPTTTTPVAVAPTIPEVKPTPVAVAPTIPTPPPAAPTQPAADQRLAQLEAGFKARYDTDAQKPFEAAVATLKQSYAANGIARARAAAQAKGSLADVTALDAEKAAMENGTGVPAEDAADTPDSLKTLRNTYRSALAKITADRTAKAIPLYNMYLGALDVYTTELTKANKLDDARKVKALRDDLATKKPEAAIVVVAPPKAEPPKPFTSTTTKAPEVKAPSGSYWRAAAKYLLDSGSGDQGGSALIIAGGKESRLRKEEDIPPGKFDFVELDIGTGTKDLTDEGFQVFNGQKNLRRIKVVSMNSPGLSDAAFAFLADNKELTYVEIGYNKEIEIGDGLIVHLSGLKKITNLSLNYAKKLTGKGMDKLACLPELQKVRFSECPSLTDDALKALGTCKKLTNLTLNGPITDAGLAALASAGSLQDLNISGCKNITGEGFAAMRGLKSLTKLNVTRTSFGDAGLVALASAGSLQELEISECKNITSEGFAAVRNLKSLTKLRVGGTSFGDAEVAAVTDIKSLTKLDLGATKITDAGVAKLTALTSLSDISLWNTQVTDAGLAKLTTLTNLKSIGVRGTQVTAAGVAAFKKALPKCGVDH